jgi:Putative zinc-finger
MDHNLASETYAAERYLLGEMPPEERDEFEEHFFSCRVCGEDVQTASVFIANAKALYRERDLQASPALKKAMLWRDWLKRDWIGWLRLPVTVPTFAALALAALVSYQNAVVIPGLRRPVSVSSPLVFDGETRSSLPHQSEDMPLYFQMLLSAPTDSARVAIQVIGANGRMVRSEFVDSPGLNRQLEVYFPGTLNAGHYTFIVRTDQGGKPGPELSRGQFEITAKY